MRHAVAVTTLAVVTSVAGGAAADCANPFAAPDEILTFNLRVTRAGWDTLRSAPAVGSGCEAEYPRVQAEFRCGETDPWIQIGAHRKRGDQRGQDTAQKPPLKLDFNYVVSGQGWPAAHGRL